MLSTSPSFFSIKRPQQADGTPLVMLAHDVEYPARGPAQARLLNRPQESFVGRAFEHERLIEITLPRKQCDVAGQPGQLRHFLNRHVAETAHPRREAPPADGQSGGEFLHKASRA